MMRKFNVKEQLKSKNLVLPFDMASIDLPVFPDRIFDITNYGAVPDGRTANTEAITRAIKDCSRSGGGVVLIPAGIWLSGPIELKSHVNLQVDANAVLLFSPDFRDYPLRLVNLNGIQKVKVTSPISGDNLENIAITGNGIIDGSGQAWRYVKKWKTTDPQWNNLLASGGYVVTNSDGPAWWPSEEAYNGRATYHRLLAQKEMNLKAYEPVHHYLRPEMVRLLNCKHVLIEGPTFQNPPEWNLHLWLCDQVLVKNVRIQSPSSAQNSDALDIDSCRNVAVLDSSFDVGDDGICVKSGKDAEGRRIGTPSENIVIAGCKVFHAHGGFVIGSEMSGGVRNCFITDSLFFGTDVGVRFKSRRGRGGVVENIYVQNLQMIDIFKHAVLFDLFYETPRDQGEGRVSEEETPHFRDIFLTNLHCQGAKDAIKLEGLPEKPIRNIRFENVHITAKNGITQTDTEDVYFQNVVIEDPYGKILFKG